MFKHKLKNYAIFPGNLIVRDEDVYRMIRKHSRFIDRLSNRKMVEMTFWAFDILNQSVEKPARKNWKFYGKNGFLAD